MNVRMLGVVFTVALIGSLCSTVYAENPPGLVWGKQIGTDQEDGIGGVVLDNSGHIYIAGWTKGTMGETHYGQGDCYLSQLSSTGDLLWSRQFGSTEEEGFNCLAIDQKNNLYAGGTTSGVMGEAHMGKTDGFFGKFDPDGNLLWMRQVGTNKDDEIKDIHVSSTGDVYVVGSTRGDLAGEHGGGTFDAFVCRYQSDGTLVWMKQHCTSLYEIGHGVTTDDEGACYITGKKGFALKYDADGNEVWSWDWSSYNYNFTSIVIDEGGYVYLAGSDPANGAGILLKMANNAAQEQIWRANYSGRWALHYGLKIVQDGSGDLITGGCKGPDCRPYSIRYTSDGQQVWLNTNIGNMGDVCGTKIITDNKGGFYQIAFAGSELFTENFGNGDGAIFKFGETINSGVQNQNALPNHFGLYQNYPNPFNATSCISYELEKEEQVNLAIYNIDGQRVKTLINQRQEAGRHSIFWNGQNDDGDHLSSGLYVYELLTQQNFERRKMLLVQ